MASSTVNKTVSGHGSSTDQGAGEQVAKRLREDDETENSARYSGEDMDQASFTVVNYKKNRGAGIPVVLRPMSPEASFWKVNPNILASAVVASAQEKVIRHRLNKDGSLMVTVSTLPAANRLLAISELAGVSVEARVPYSYSATYGKIQDVPLEYSDEELQRYLQAQGVISARRQVSYVPCDEGGVAESRRRSVILEFSRDSPMPKRIVLGFCSYPVLEYIGSATQCFRCQRHGHIAKHCNGPIRCKICSGAHTHKECKSRAQPLCANCGGSHPASYGGCPKKKAATLARHLEQIQGKAPRRNEPPPNPDVVFTSIEPQHKDTSLPGMSSKKTFASVIKGHLAEESSSKTLQAKPRGISSAGNRQHTPKNPHTPSTSHEKQTDSSVANDISSLLIPMMFAAIKALLRAAPSSKSLPEVEAVLALEHLVTATYAPQRYDSSTQQ